ELTFGGNAAVDTDIQYKVGEVWLYLTYHADYIKISHPDFSSTEFTFPYDMKPNGCYELTLVNNFNQGPVVPEKTMYNYLIVKADQPNAVITIDGQYAGEGEASKSFKVGETHTWSIECELYHPESGNATIVKDNAVTVEKTLRPAFGFINITSTPESGATVFVDNKKVGTTPFKTDRIASGEHKVRVMKEMYSTAEKTITVTDGNTTQAAISLSANFVNATVTTDSNADIYIDSELKGKGRWTGRLSDGSHTFEARKASHKPSLKNVTLTLGKDENITITSPEPIYGTLDVNSEPMEAAIIIDGVRRGETPAIINDILIGTHELRLEKSGCATVTKTITLDEKNLLAVNEKLQTGREISISTDQQGDQLYADGNYLGASPLTATLTFGVHTIKAVRDSKAVEKTITVAQTGGDGSVRLVFKFKLKNRTFTVNGVTFEMIAVKGGTFTMGASSGDSYADSDEKPTHSVTLGNYYMGKFEVTQELWEAVMGSNPSEFKGSKLPVEQVSWDDCQTFIRKLNSLTGANFRLPTEAEWEYAARGGSKSKGYKYSGSNSIGEVAWYWENSGDRVLSGGWDAARILNNNCKTHTVGSKSPNELGIYDMSGNVYEWCQDWYGSYGSGSQTNPQGPSSGSGRVRRGGCWYNNASYCRVSNRGSNTPGNRDNNLGFRVVLIP
ncbi:MAG: SUMF1/EgtB/PvdO family nonheme iron enzyme, partial [bacterium]|nr:SUMF1/EgtB/PvdO family nonheme iron enzyme [Candidatus Limimorpha caballi]